MQAPRNKLGLFAASLTACISVALIGLGFTMLLNIAGLGSTYGYESQSPIIGGIAVAAMLSMMNFVLFFITVPAAFFGLALTLGIKPYSPNVRRFSYFREAALVGGFLVGLVSGLFGLAENLQTSAVAALSGGLIGALSGLVCAKVYLIIVKPEKLGQGIDPDIFS